MSFIRANFYPPHWVEALAGRGFVHKLTQQSESFSKKQVLSGACGKKSRWAWEWDCSWVFHKLYNLKKARAPLRASFSPFVRLGLGCAVEWIFVPPKISNVETYSPSVVWMKVRPSGNDQVMGQSLPHGIHALIIEETPRALCRRTRAWASLDTELLVLRP